MPIARAPPDPPWPMRMTTIGVLKIARDGLADAALLRLYAAVGALGVDERDDRPAVFFRLAHQAQGLAVAFRQGHSPVALEILLEIAAALLADHRHRLAIDEADAADHGRIVGEKPIAVKLDEIVEDGVDVVERRRPLNEPRQFHLRPGGIVVVVVVVELGFQLLDFIGDVEPFLQGKLFKLR